jgi:hypothetical protein
VFVSASPNLHVGVTIISGDAGSCVTVDEAVLLSDG